MFVSGDCGERERANAVGGDHRSMLARFS